MNTAKARAAEYQKYRVAYTQPNYRMGGGRYQDAINDMTGLPVRGSYLDVGCGRGEMLCEAECLGFGPVHGVEIVPELTGPRVTYGEAHDLPFQDNHFDVVSLFDVIEHLLPGDDELVCRELHRVAARHVLLTANNRPSRLPSGEDLHINIRSYEEWDALFRRWFAGSKVMRIGGKRFYISEGWRIDL